MLSTPGRISPVTAPSAPRTARARVREELTREIKDAARRHLGESGPFGLSLRAVAREVGMVSSAVYRYFPSRDALLTALIVDSYNAVGQAVEDAEQAVDPSHLLGRWLAVCTAMRAWAVGSPHEYALIFGSPVPGYRAPTDTIDPAARIPLRLIAIAGAAGAAGAEVDPILPGSVAADLTALRDAMAPTLSLGASGRVIMAWTQLVGSISFELFGHLNNVIHDYEAYFEYQMTVVGAGLGLTQE
ncbi:MAG: transcriptional regulator, TetR family [Jatrophihabitantaceae bacterium]|nr:transcriptional regulator, TetR family [Jatrophihabitantaceae bacterium]